VENAKAGGDNAARGMILGMIYGAAGEVEKLPGALTSGLNATEEIERILKPS
jgi:ADP-ribosylglycohydrolase